MGRAEALQPSRVLVLRLSDEPVSARPLSSEAAAQSLVTGTYMAGELRRFWPFAATLAAGLGAGPSHPAVEARARELAEALPCSALSVRRGDLRTLGELLTQVDQAVERRIAS